MAQSGEGASGLYRGAQAGYFRSGAISFRHRERRFEFLEPVVRAAFQRTSFSASYLLPVHYEDNPCAKPRQSDCSVLCRGTLVPKELQDKDTTTRFLEAVEQFASIVRESGHIRLRRLGADEIAGTPESSGILERYLTLSPSGKTPLQDMRLDPDRMWIGDKALCLHTLSDLDDLPGSVHTDDRYECLSTERSDCRLSFAAPVGLLLSCNHIYNQYVRQEVV